MNIRYSKVTSLMLALIMILSTVGTVVFAAPSYYDNLEAANGSVALDGTNPGTVTVSVVGTADMDVYAIQGSWDTAETEGSGKLQLTGITSSLMTFTGMNYVDTSTGNVMWSDDTFSAPAVVADGTEFLSATYSVAADTPAGTYTVRFCTEVLTATDYNSYLTLTYYTATVTVTRPAAHVCSGTFVKGQAATCTVDGWNDYYSCTCGKFYEDQGCTNRIADLAAWKTGDGKITAAHAYGTLVDQNNGTHTSTTLVDGMKAHYFCDVCDTYFTEGKVATTKEALTIKNVHSYTTQNGYKAAEGHANTCSCGAKDTVTPHTPGAPATETTDQVCTVCDFIIVPKTGHIHKNNLTPVAETPAGCTVDGNKAYYECSCGKYFEDDSAVNEIADLAAWKAKGGNGYVKEKGHSFNTKVSDQLASKATCQAPATYYVECDNCTEVTTEKALKKDDVLDPANHTSDKIVYKNATTTTHDEHYKCCDALKTAGVAHTYGASTHTCVCGAENHTHAKYASDKNGHWSVCSCGKVLSASAAHDNDGELCEICGYVYHTCGGQNMSSFNKPADACDPAKNVKYYICSCGKIYSDADGKNQVTFASHVTQIISGVNPTCARPGCTSSVRCIVCGETVIAPIYIPALEHKWSDWVVTDPAEEGKDGTETRTCDLCKKQETRVIPALDHVHTLVKVAAQEATCEVEGNIEYWYCKNCDWIEVAGGVASNRQAVKTPAAHKLVKVEAKEATCEENGNIEYWYCSACDWIEVEGGVASNRLAVQTPAAHKLVNVPAKAASCTENGNIEYWYCENCDWIEVAGGVASNRLAVQTPAAHKLVKVDAKASTCFEMGNIEYWYCENCVWVEVAGGVASNKLAVMLPLAHVVEHVEAKAATATETGNIEYWYCKDCGYAWLDEACTKNTNLKAVILPATGETTDPVNPGTGDNAIFFAVALVAVAVAGVAVISFKKKED